MDFNVSKKKERKSTPNDYYTLDLTRIRASLKYYFTHDLENGLLLLIRQF